MVYFTFFNKVSLTLHPEFSHLIFFENSTFNAFISNIFVVTFNIFFYFIYIIALLVNRLLLVFMVLINALAYFDDQSA